MWLTFRSLFSSFRSLYRSLFSKQNSWMTNLCNDEHWSVIWFLQEVAKFQGKQPWFEINATFPLRRNNTSAPHSFLSPYAQFSMHLRVNELVLAGELSKFKWPSFDVSVSLGSSHRRSDRARQHVKRRVQEMFWYEPTVRAKSHVQRFDHSKII